MSFPRYPEYKDSGVQWLGEVPEHWEIDRFKRSVESCRNGIWGSDPDDGEGLPCMRVADFDRTRLRVATSHPTLRAVSERESEGRLLSRGNLLLEKSGGGDNQPVGFVVMYDEDQHAICSNFVAKMSLLADMEPSYWCYLHHAAYAVRLNTRSIKQTSGIQNLDQQAYLDEAAPFPPPDEQQAIAAFLDRETAKIDALVAEQRRLIELLKEKRQAVISHAVTQGLNPDAPRKPSGIPWLGNVPEHWEVDRFKWSVSSCRNGVWGSEPHDTMPGTPCMRVADFDRTTLKCSMNEPTFRVLSESDRQGRILQRGDLLLEKSGGGDNQPVGCVVQYDHDVEAVCANFVARMKLADGMHSRFWCYQHSVAYAARWNIRSIKQTSGIQNLDQKNYLDEIAVFPPQLEQREIAEHLDDATSKIDAVILQQHHLIELLTERRTALISAAVTGKIDVRGVVAKEEVAA